MTTIHRNTALTALTLLLPIVAFAAEETRELENFDAVLFGFAVADDPDP